MFAFWNSEATAQSNSGAKGGSGTGLPLGVKCIVTLDARSNSRSNMTQEMQNLSGFVRQDTVQGTLIQQNSQWLILKDQNNENWIPRDKVLLVRTSR